MAKKKRKPRTPPPPRRPEQRKADLARAVQAPQAYAKKRASLMSDNRARLLLYSLGGSGILGLVVVLLAFLLLGGNGGKKPSDLKVDFAKLPGISHGKPPWEAQINDLALRLPPLGLHALPQEALKEHIHQHLDIFVNGKREPVPESVGIAAGQFITELHTHDTTGIIHVESAETRPYSLGQFFGVWGVFLSKRCIGGDCAKPGRPLKFYADGKRYREDPVTLELSEHEEIAIVYGKPPAKIPKSYAFPPGA